MIPASVDVMSNTEYVFVYGTLRKGASNAFRMKGGDFVGRARVKGRLYFIDWYPALVLDEESDLVTGEVWKVSSEKLAELDVFEGLEPGEMEGEEYRRTKLQISVDGHEEPIKAWLWEWLKDVEDYRRVPSGDWFDVPQSR